VTEVYVRWWVKMAEAECRCDGRNAHQARTQILRTPPEILTAFLKAWDEIAKEESDKNRCSRRSTIRSAHGRRWWFRQALPVSALLFRRQPLLAYGSSEAGEEGGCGCASEK